jgi:HK97 family phage prohead protease
MDREVRFLLLSPLEVRSSDAAPAIRGYAAKFNVLSENLGGFREQILPGAFAGVIDSDVRALINHDANLVLGRTAAKTLALGEDETGLWYEASLPETQFARDLLVSIKRGDVTQSSFAFTISPDGEDDWSEDDEGRVLRTIKKIGRLFDVSPVTYPAYPDATVGARSFEAYQKRKTDAQKETDRVAYELRKRNESQRALKKRRLQIIEKI